MLARQQRGCDQMFSKGNLKGIRTVEEAPVKVQGGKGEVLTSTRCEVRAERLSEAL